MEKLCKGLKRFLIPVLVTLGIVFLLFTQISWKDLYALWRRIDPYWISFGALGYFLSILLRAYRYQWLIYSRKIPVFDLFRISVFYNLSLMVLPSKLGELTYPYFLNKLSGMPMTEGLASLIASRIYDFFSILILFFIAFIGFQGFFRVNPTVMLSLIAFAIGLTLLAFFYMSGLLRLLSTLIRKIFQRIGVSQRASFQWVIKKTETLAQDFNAIQAKRTYLPVTLASLASWVFSYWMFYGFLRGFGIAPPVMEVVFGTSIAIVANVIPISGIGNWGILEAGWAAGFMLVGLSKVEAIATGFGVHIILFVTSATVSFFCWATLKKR